MTPNVRRKTFVTRGADPTEVIEYTVLGTQDAFGRKPGDGTYLKLQQFQDVITATLHRPDGTVEEVPEVVGRMIYDGLEREYDAEQELA